MKITAYVEAKRQMAALNAQIQGLEQDPQFKALERAEQQLRAIMEAQSLSAEDLAALLQLLEPDLVIRVGQRGKPARKLRRYRNPHTGEEVASRGGNDRILKQWRETYGYATVKAWVLDD